MVVFASRVYCTVDSPARLEDDGPWLRHAPAFGEDAGTGVRRHGAVHVPFHFPEPAAPLLQSSLRCCSVTSCPGLPINCPWATGSKTPMSSSERSVRTPPCCGRPHRRRGPPRGGGWGRSAGEDWPDAIRRRTPRHEQDCQETQVSVRHTDGCAFLMSASPCGPS